MRIQDWFHESCLNLRERPVSPVPSREPTPAAQTHPKQEEHPEDDDARSEASSSGLPPPLLGATAYDAFVCASCVQKIATLKRYAGTPGVLMVVRDKAEDAWRIEGSVSDEDIKVEDVVVDADAASVKIEQDGDALVGDKRPHPDDPADVPDAKRHRTSGDGAPAESLALNGASKICLAPRANSLAQRILDGATSLGAGDVFLTEDWRERWCQCYDVSAVISVPLLQ